MYFIDGKMSYILKKYVNLFPAAKKIKTRPIISDKIVSIYLINIILNILFYSSFVLAL